MTNPYRHAAPTPRTVEELEKENAALRAELDDIAAVPQLPWWVLRFDRWGENAAETMFTACIIGGILVLGASGAHAGALCSSLGTGEYMAFWIWVMHLFIPAGLWFGYCWASYRRLVAHGNPTLPKGWVVCRRLPNLYQVGKLQGGSLRVICDRRTLEGALDAAQAIGGGGDD